jgi:hypothetical protein
MIWRRSTPLAGQLHDIGEIVKGAAARTSQAA